MDRMALSRFYRPKYLISRWIDFNERYGLGYQLSDFSVGILFIDNSRHVVDTTMKIFQYKNKNGSRDYFEYVKCPTRLDKKFNVLEYTKKHLKFNLLVEPLVEEIKVVDRKIPILIKWRKDDKSICFLLFNSVIQVNLLEDRTKFIVSLSTKSISIFDKDNKLKNYRYKRLALYGLEEVIKNEMLYVKEVIEDRKSLRRKHEDDDSAVPVKKLNNNK